MMTRSQAAAQKRALWRDIERAERAKVRAHLAELRMQLRDARARRKQALHDAKERCRAERLAARERARTLRIRVLEELREMMRAERAAARQTCSAGLGEARAIKNDVERARAELLAEEKYRRDLRRIEHANRQRRREAPRVTRIERRSESDDEIRSNISPDLIPLFERVKRSIKATPRMSRTEAFLKWVEEHPAELLEAIEDKTEATIRDLERQERQATRALRRPQRSVRTESEVPF